MLLVDVLARSWGTIAAKMITKTAFQKEMFWENSFRNHSKADLMKW